MSFDEALADLKKHGVADENARTALQHALSKADTDLVDVLVAKVSRMKVPEILREFGQDGGRAVLILCRDL